MNKMINFFKDLIYILSGRWAKDYDLWNGPVTPDKLEKQREAIRKFKS